jgi:hypothetical protein
MPHHRAGAEAELESALGEPPAQVHVVAGGAVADVEAVDRLQGCLPERHVAARDVLGILVGEQHVRGPAGRSGDALGDPVVARRHDVGSADAGVVAAPERIGQVVEPVRVRARVVVGVGHDLAGRGPHPGVARTAQAAVLGADQPHVVLRRDRRDVVLGTVVDDDHLEVRVLDAGEPLEAVAERARAVVAADHDRDTRPRVVGRERHLAHGALDGGERRFGRAVAVGEAERPVVDVFPAPVPLVGPRINERTRCARRERGAHLPGEGLGLAQLAVAHAVEPDLGQHQRSIAGEVLEPGEVGLQPVAILEVDVEAVEVEERQLQVLGGGIVDVRDQRAGILLADERAQSLDVALDAAGADPAHDRRRDLVRDREREQRRVAEARPRGGDERVLVLTAPATFADVADGALATEADEQPEPVLERKVQQPARRRRVRAHGIEAVARHEREIAVDGGRRRVLVAVGIGPERAVGDAAHVELLDASEQELALGAGTGEVVGGCGDRGQGLDRVKAHALESPSEDRTRPARSLIVGDGWGWN